MVSGFRPLLSIVKCFRQVRRGSAVYRASSSSPLNRGAYALHCHEEDIIQIMEGMMCPLFRN